MFWSVYLLPSFLPCISLTIPTICLYICSRFFATNWDLLSQLAVSLHFCNFVLFSSLRGSCIFAGCPIVEKGWMYTAELMTFPASAPQLVYQRLWYVPPCLCSSAYTRAGHCVPVTGFYLVLTSINVHHSPTSILITVQQHEEYSDPTSQSCCWHQYHFPEQVEIFNSIINTRSKTYSST